MNCNSCIKINSIPACIDSEVYKLTGLTFPDHVNANISVRLRDSATGRVEYIYITTDADGDIVQDGIDLAPFYPLMNHYFELRFFDGASGSPIDFLLTNPDESEVTGCCIEFIPYDGLTGSESWAMSTEGCTV
jgi:hypothetical protein